MPENDNPQSLAFGKPVPAACASFGLRLPDRPDVQTGRAIGRLLNCTFALSTLPFTPDP
jgi:hypothetical protein